MRFIGNLIWFICGGLLLGLAWWLLGCLSFISIVGIPWGKACFVMGNFTFSPFGKEAIKRSELTGKEDIGTGFLGFLGNVIWFFCGGFWLAVGHVASGIICFCTIIGIPFGVQHFKLAYISLAPIGMTIVPKKVAEAARKG